MSRSVKIKKPKWTDPEDKKYLSFFGTLLHGLRMAEVRIPSIGFEIKRRVAPAAIEMEPQRALVPVSSKPRAITEVQRRTLQAIASAADKARYVPKALPGNADTLVIDMTKVSDGKVPVYARRSQ